jgi:DNA mismatch repair protein MSH3
MKASQDVGDEKANALFEKVLKLPEHVTICLSALINHLTSYGLEHVFDLTKYFTSFSARSHMLLNGNTLSSLEIYRNQTDNTEKGSLFWSLDRTRTKFGQRMLRRWVGRPLLDKQRLEERIRAVGEFKDAGSNAIIGKLQSLLSKLRIDLEKSLIRIYYGKCTRPELLNVLQAMQRVANEFGTVKSAADVGFESSAINEAIAFLPTIADDLVGFLEKINSSAAREDDKYDFFREEFETEGISDHKIGIASVEQDLEEFRRVAAEKIGRKMINYKTVAGIDYLVEVDNPAKKVPASWIKISGTKKVSRFHPPEIIKMIRERDQHKEALANECDAAYRTLLADISAKYQSLRDTVQTLATLDCLLSLADVANQLGYVKPTFTEETCIEIQQGRHPMVEQLLIDSYVPNDTSLQSSARRALLVTGPNMGGKSSYVRQVALIAIMAQIGSYVPADSARIGILDAVLTRMGAFDNMMAGESTFMVELSETADMLKTATPRSLVILDELGRGTSTHDGVAIAQAVLDYLVRDIKALTLFITHYQDLASVAKGFEGGELANVHMRFEENGPEEVVFLYEVADGIAHRSYGLNVARLAHLPESVLDVARVKSAELEYAIRGKKLEYMSKAFNGLLEGNTISPDALDLLVTGIEQL